MGKNRLFNVQLFAAALVCLAINVICAKLVLHFELPLFLDSIGTILAGALLGYLPGIIVGFASNYILSLGDYISLYYGALSVLIAIAAAFLSRRGAFKKIGPALASVFLFAFIGGSLGSLLTWGLYGLNIGSGISAPLALALNANTQLGKFLSQFIADTGIDLADKFVTVLAVFSILKFLPRRCLDALPFGYIYKNGNSVAAFSGAIAKTYRNFSLRTKIASLIIATSLILGLTSVSISYGMYSNMMNKRYRYQCTAAVELMCRRMNGDTVKGFIATSADTIGYSRALQELYSIRDCISEIKYMYVYQIKEDGCHVIFDLNTKDTPGARFGDVVTFDSSFKKYLPSLLAGKEIPPVITKGQYGWLLSVYKPLRDSEGKTIAYAAADISMENVMTDRYIFIIRVLSLLFGVSIIITTFAIWFAQNKIVAPINSLATATSKFAYESEDERRQNTGKLETLNIRTGDEIEYLYSAINKTMNDIDRYMRVIEEKNIDVAQKASIISRMQDNIIISFADMVENRDENTGSHIRRTADYVRIISEEMNRRGCYKGLLGGDYINKLYKSAPLHDVGKIRIPDAILNKEGKLTPEEFTNMKTHTTAGGAILEHVLKGVESDNYLSEAQNMAVYHHEWWNGAGYPNGLKGSDIPLSARIMAIADVFDALVSTRSYKGPFSFKDAVAIIKDESGSHFDPDVVEAFLNCLEEIKKVSQKYDTGSAAAC